MRTYIVTISAEHPDDVLSMMDDLREYIENHHVINMDVDDMTTYNVGPGCVLELTRSE